MPSNAPGSLSSVQGVATATQTAGLAPLLEPWLSPGNGGSRPRERPCGFPNGWTATQARCPSATRCPRLRPRPRHRPAGTPGTLPTQEMHRRAPTTMAAGGAPGTPPQGGPGTRQHRAPELRRDREEPLPRDVAVQCLCPPDLRVKYLICYIEGQDVPQPSPNKDTVIFKITADGTQQFEGYYPLTRRIEGNKIVETF